MSEIFKEGDIVVLKSGNLRMIVTSSTEETTDCEYHNPITGAIESVNDIKTSLLELYVEKPI